MAATTLSFPPSTPPSLPLPKQQPHRFTDTAPHSAAIQIPSTWRTAKPKRENEVQTDTIHVRDVEVQVLARRDANLQTDPEPPPRFRLLSTYDQGAMRDFLAGAEPMISAQLLQNIRSSAFDGWLPQWQTPHTSTTLLHELVDPNLPSDMLITDLSWNKNGTTVACGYGRLDHESWCGHKGGVVTWSLGGRGVGERPGWEVETESCVMCVAFHPELPSRIAVGVYNGQILILQTTDIATSIVAISRMSDEAHQEPVAKVEWVRSDKEGVWNIVSIANDGKILTWDPSNGLSMPIAGSRLTMEKIPRKFRGGPTVKSDIVLGGTAFSLSTPTLHSQTYIAATESGHIIKCSRDLCTPISTNKPQHQLLRNPITFAYEPHTGAVNAVACSPFHRNVFVSAGSDGGVRVWNGLQPKPLLTLFPTPYPHSPLALLFSPTRATVFALTTSTGLLHIYDLASSTSLPHTTVQCTANAGVAGTALAFSGAVGVGGEGQYLATADAEGKLRVWRVASGLAEECNGREWGVVERLGSVLGE
ncbi:WD40-repeat-containing domain protein [Fimicolochytrium jonesii]|uniref:WD40-repeat-containing domain protein n=1 Tax=Fimicolochytrium jonesii TaxID=1396493 RepID=UPI0022FDCC85|nr:WD40-repeat-containing domain protein [Fimicolochytrium jonesii]KAI8825213.1 WD40-repeat-containing domain protein [Fimicolochytrium jonesii]